MHDKNFVQFTKEMKKDYTILVPNMLPMHFKLIISIMKTYGCKMELLESTDSAIAETGLQYTHNDTCYPAILVVGQFIHALKSGKYDPHKTALIMFQTGGGCRASNYIFLIRKALKKAGMEYVPVISFNLAGLEKHPGFKMSLKLVHNLLYAAFYGDLLMNLVNQTRTYEINKGESKRLADEWTEKLGAELGNSKHIRYRKIKENYKKIIESFSKIKTTKKDGIRVGIVGEIYVKYSPLANNGLEDFLVSEGAEPVVPGLIDFCLYCVSDFITTKTIYKRTNFKYYISRYAFRFLSKKRDDISKITELNSDFRGWTPFSRVVELAGDLISTAVKMGEGWLLTAEMMELAESGCKNIVCTQPFGCLPNHICGKGMMKPIKELKPDVNIVAIDYDAGASKVNQENRIKLMLANAEKNKRSENSIKANTPSVKAKNAELSK